MMFSKFQIYETKVTMFCISDNDRVIAQHSYSFKIADTNVLSVMYKFNFLIDVKLINRIHFF